MSLMSPATASLIFDDNDCPPTASIIKQVWLRKLDFCHIYNRQCFDESEGLVKVHCKVKRI